MVAEGYTSPYPPELLFSLAWTFRGQAFADRTTFDAAVAGAQNPEWGEGWRPEDVVLYAPHVRVSPDVAWYLTDDHPNIEFVADNGKSFTAGELLFKVHNAFVAELRQMDHKYFEGFSLAEDQEPCKPPLYNLNLGS